MSPKNEHDVVSTCAVCTSDGERVVYDLAHIPSHRCSALVIVECGNYIIPQSFDALDSLAEVGGLQKRSRERSCEMGRRTPRLGFLAPSVLLRYVLCDGKDTSA